MREGGFAVGDGPAGASTRASTAARTRTKREMQPGRPPLCLAHVRLQFSPREAHTWEPSDVIVPLSDPHFQVQEHSARAGITAHAGSVHSRHSNTIVPHRSVST